jgi:RNA polymerase sigma factor (sigma-70 family)
VGFPIRRANAIAAVLEGFRVGRPQDVEAVRGWVGHVLRGGNWRFSDPEGVAQEIVLRLHELVRDDRVLDAESFQKFVYTVAKHVCVKTYHRERRRAAREQPEAEGAPVAGTSNPESDLEQRERLELVVTIFQRLPEPCRDLWGWVYQDELSASEIAAKLGTTANNVRVRVHRCLEKARAIHAALQGLRPVGLE